jgi:myo-inositol-1(or 4)-monophosphatase
MQQQHPMLNIAIKAARRAGSIITRASMDLDSVKVSSKGPGDFVTEVDKMVEADIIDTLLYSYPQHGFLGEESGVTGNENSPYRWIIDPLDGTTNFIHGLPHYAVSIALTFEGEVITGCIFAPATNDLYTTEKGRGSSLNSRRLRVSKRHKFHEAVIGVNVPNARGASSAAVMQAAAELNMQTAGTRRWGASVLDLAFVAAGRLDGYWGAGLKPWDMAVASLLIKEAGGLVSDADGKTDFMATGHIVAGTPKIFAQLLTRVQPILGGPKNKPASVDSESADAPTETATAEVVAEPAKATPRRTLKRRAAEPGKPQGRGI